jgi:tRNA (guanine-N7-)-methyltransferase
MEREMERIERKREFYEIRPVKAECIGVCEWFGNDNEICVEIGSGRGEFLKFISEKEQYKNFIGIEFKEKRIDTILKKLEPEDNPNVKICKMIADESLAEYFAPNSIKHIYIIHPDPWPKRRHHKKRLISPAFIDALDKILTKDGIIDITTDHCGYALWILHHFDEHESFEPSFERGFSFQKPNDYIDTYFEKKKKDEGLKPIYMQFNKKRG